jgi:uncharacterized protein (TIGR03066 family)
MMHTLVAALALGLVAHGKAVTEVRQSNCWLIVGTWEWRGRDGIVEVWEFRRNGRFTLGVHDPDGRRMMDFGTYRVDGQRVHLDFRGMATQTIRLVQLDRRELVWSWCGPTRYRRR